MFKQSTLLILPAILISACTSMQGTEQGPQAGLDSFKSAFNAHDAAGVADLYREDGKLLPPNRPMVTGKDAIRAYWQGAFTAGVSHIKKTPVEVTISGDLAVETSSYVVTFKDNDIHGKDTLVWRRGPGNVWKITSDIWNSDK